MLELLLSDTKPREPFRMQIAEGLRLTARIETRIADRLQPRRATTDVRCR